MQVCLHYPKIRFYDVFEGARLRKTLKGACESLNIPWEDSVGEKTDIAHFLSPKDEKELYSCKEKGIKTVVSCFYSENDPVASFLIEKKGKKVIPAKTVRMMNSADLVLVPTEQFALMARDNGVTAPLKILPAGVNLDRFARDSLEAEIFPRYFQVRPNQKFALALGSYEDQTTLEMLQSIAKKTPQFLFYFFGSPRKGDRAYLNLNRLKKKAPENLRFERLVEDDVYRSALLHCSAFLLLDHDHPDQMGALDAFAAKAEIVAVGDMSVNPFLHDQANCLIVPDAESASTALARLYQGPDEAIIMAGYKAAESRALPIFAKQLGEIYEELLSKNQGENHD